jgi:UDP-glucose 4-epimerase
VRDYIHIVDLAEGHVKVLNKLSSGKIRGFVAYNLGTGCGYSVLDMVKGFSETCGHPIPYEIVDRRPGDIATFYADPKLATKELDWSAKRGLKEMCEDAWRWQKSNPKGYQNS